MEKNYAVQLTKEIFKRGYFFSNFKKSNIFETLFSIPSLALLQVFHKYYVYQLLHKYTYLYDNFRLR